MTNKLGRNPIQVTYDIGELVIEVGAVVLSPAVEGRTVERTLVVVDLVIEEPAVKKWFN